MEKSRNPVNAVPMPHPLKEIITKNRIPLWKVIRIADIQRSECWLSRSLAGIQPMPADIEQKLAGALGRLEGGAA